MCTYGIDRVILASLLKTSDTFQDFSQRVFDTFAALRGKRCRLFIEKTPQNIHCAADFLRVFKNGVFLHIVRNPLFVYKSLIGRGFPPYIAMNTWLVDESSVFNLHKHPRFLTVKYEDLVAAPYKCVCNLLGKLGIEYDPGDLEKNYHNNTYRKHFSLKIDSWTINRYGVSDSANQPKRIDATDRQRLSWMLNTIVSRRYADEFMISPVRFGELIAHYGYDFQALTEQVTGRRPWYDSLSVRWLLMKYFLDLIYRQCQPGAISAYLKPVVRKMT